MRHPQQAGHDSLGDAGGGTPHPRAPAATPFAYPKEEHPRDTGVVAGGTDIDPQLDRTRQGRRDARDEPQAPQEGDGEGSAQIHAAFCHAGLANRPRLLAPGDTVTLAEPH